MDSSFHSAWWLPGPHLQTLWAALVRRKPAVSLRWERLELPDGDFIDLSWVNEEPSKASNKKSLTQLERQPSTATDNTSTHQPIVIILHGLNGSVNSPYARGLLQAVVKKGWRGVVMHFRGCSTEPNRLARCYHSGETGDINYVVEQLVKREPNTPLYAVGYSLGGNVLLKWLGETGSKNPLKKAVAVSVPFELNKTADHMNQGASRWYQSWLVHGLKKMHQNKAKTVPELLKLGDIIKLNSFWEFDDQVTARLHGFKNAQDYYTQSSSRQYLSHIAVPTLLLQARNDPFTPPEALPTANEISAKITLELSDQGGHVGFVSGKYPWQPIYWLEQRIINFLDNK